MPTVYVDGKAVSIGAHEQLNLIQVAERAGVEIPYYCWHPGLSVVASCRMCLVEVGQRDAQGTVRMLPRLVPACATPATDGLVVVTNSPKVAANRAFVEEYLLLDHPVDCPICDRAGECYLQDYYYRYGRRERRAPSEPFTSRRKDVGPWVTLFVDRCVLCSRCVRFTREVAGTAELAVVKRGNRSIIDVFPGYELENKLSGNVVDLCPVGALCSRDFLYQQRVWFLRSHRSICVGCATGCSIFIDENKDRIYRLRPRYNPQTNTWWMCDEGRFGWKYVHSLQRLRHPVWRNAGREERADWEALARQLPGQIRQSVAEVSGSAFGAVFSPFLTCEEAYLARQFFSRLGIPVRWYWGPVPIVGEDDHYPKSLWGSSRADEPVRFVIRAEKCPNRLGVSLVLPSGEAVGSFDQFLSDVAQGHLAGACILGGYPCPWIDEPRASGLSRLRFLVVHDLFRSPASRRAHWVLPMTSWAEKEGSYVNADGVLQYVERALMPIGEARSAGRFFWTALGRTSLYQVRLILQELAAAIPAFAPAPQVLDGAGEYGVRLPLAERAPSAVPASASRTGTP
jgi:NADH-quinone oxidoreductase subunit G